MLRRHAAGGARRLRRRDVEVGRDRGRGAAEGGNVIAEGDLDFRGTLGVDKEAPVGFAEIRLRFEVDTDAPQDKLDLLLKLTERYCVVYQTIKNGPKISVIDEARVISRFLILPWRGKIGSHEMRTEVG